MYNWYIEKLHNLHMIVDPINKVRGLGIYSRVASLSTAIAPRHNTGQLVSTHEGATRVSLARVLSSHSSTDHGVKNVFLSIRSTTVIIRDNWHVNLLESSGQTATFSGGTPPSDSTHGSSRVLLATSGQGDCVNVLAGEISTVSQSQDADVSADGPVIIIPMKDHLGDSNVSLVFILLV